MKKRFLSMFALLLMAATGAWAQEETLLTTITATETGYSETTPGVVTVTHDNDYFDDEYGWLWWHAGSITVEAKEGYTITKCVFRQADKSTTVTISTAPFKVNFVEIRPYEEDPDYVKYLCEGTPMWDDIDGFSKIEVYGPAPAPATTYSVTLAEGTEDFDKWTISPTEAAEGETVTVTYSGEKKVKSVKAVKKEVVKPDLLPAVFTVDAGKTVKFSKGNLQATYNGSSWIWGFAEHQWDYIGNAAGNTSINGNGTVSANGTVDLFGWVGASSTWTGAAQYGISNSTATNNVDGYGNVGGEAQKVGWGATVGAGWRTLTRLEWLHLLNGRETGVTVNSTNHARYTLAIINTDGTAVKGLIIFPDSYAGGSPAGVTWGTINAKSTFETTCTSAGWTALEAAGCVFLPAAGYRTASTVTDAGIGGGYWSSSSGYAVSAVGPYFESDYMTIQFVSSRKYGYSVRLVRDAD